MHAEEPATVVEQQPAETAGPPAVEESVPPAAAAAEDHPGPVTVPEIVVADADLSTAGPPEIAAQPATNDDPGAASVPAPSQAGPAATPTDPPTAVAPQNPRRKRRAKGWSCPVCRQRKYSRITISHPSRAFFFFDPLADALHPFFFHVQLTHPCCGLRPPHQQWMEERKENASRLRPSTIR